MLQKNAEFYFFACLWCRACTMPGAEALSQLPNLLDLVMTFFIWAHSGINNIIEIGQSFKGFCSWNMCHNSLTTPPSNWRNVFSFLHKLDLCIQIEKNILNKIQPAPFNWKYIYNYFFISNDAALSLGVAEKRDGIAIRLIYFLSDWRGLSVHSISILANIRLIANTETFIIIQMPGYILITWQLLK